MYIKPTLEKLKDSKEFEKWKNKNKKTYFSYAFRIPQEMEGWHIGFYDKGKDKITTFEINGSISIRPEEEMFKKEESKVHEVELNNLKLTFDEILEKAAEFQTKNFPKDNTIKTIAILQNSQDYGDVWNITYITQSFNTLNMKIDASTGKVKDHKISSIFSFSQE